MKCILAKVKGKIAWAVRETDQLFECLPKLHELRFVNPALLVSSSAHQSDVIAKPTFIGVDGTYFYTSNGFLFDLECSHFRNKSWDIDFAIEIDKIITRFCKFLRFVSKQATLPARLECCGVCEIEELRPYFPAKGESCITQSWHLRTAVRSEHIKLVGTMNPEWDVPSYDSSLLNAIENLIKGDFENAFIQAMRAIELVGFAHARQSIGAVLVEPDCGRNKLSFLYKRVSGARAVSVDSLVRKAKFKEYLHEVPLVTRNRSLCRERKELYDEVLRLYEVRNEVMHRGVPSCVTEATDTWE